MIVFRIVIVVIRYVECCDDDNVAAAAAVAIAVAIPLLLSLSSKPNTKISLHFHLPKNPNSITFSSPYFYLFICISHFSFRMKEIFLMKLM